MRWEQVTALGWGALLVVVVTSPAWLPALGFIVGRLTA